MKSGCPERNNIPGEAKGSLPFTEALSIMAGSKAFLKD